MTTQTQQRKSPRNNVFLKLVENHLILKFPYFSKIINKRASEFGLEWEERFEMELATFFKDEESLRKAVVGYGLFALDGLKLQKKFDKTLYYEHQSYDEIKSEVYFKEDYMFGLYLPGILLSHYLWPHHYNQLKWFLKKFIPLVKGARAQTFCDVGVGTGFYSKEMLRNLPKILGQGYDISEFSLQHTKTMLERWGFGNRYKYNKGDIFDNPPAEKAEAAVNVEVLEHLKNPLKFLEAFRKMLKDEAYAFITAAIDAPNKDHIYLYRNLESVAKQLREAGFEIVDQRNFPAFDNPKPGETVPQNGSFIVKAV